MHVQDNHLLRWEQSRRDVELANGDIANSIREPIYTRINRIFEALPETDRRILKDIEIEILNAPAGMFVFESGFDLERRIPIIRTSSETIATLIKITMAQQVSTLSESPDEWLTRYLLYVRGTRDGRLIVDPLRASGIINERDEVTKSVTREQLREIDRLAKLKFDEVLTFILAHEIAHLIKPRSQKQIFETQEKYLERVRADESRADAAALDILRTIEETQTEPDGRKLPLYLIGAPQLFLQWIVTMQGVRHSLSPTTHPLDHIRAAAVIERIETILPKIPISEEERTGILMAISSSKRALDNINKLGISSHSAMLDALAAGIKPEELKFVN